MGEGINVTIPRDSPSADRPGRIDHPDQSRAADLDSSRDFTSLVDDRLETRATRLRLVVHSPTDATIRVGET